MSGSTGTVDYDVVIPQISGGDPAVVTEFNESMRAAIEDQIHHSDDTSYTLSSQEHEVTRIGDHVVAGLLVQSMACGAVSLGPRAARSPGGNVIPPSR